MDYVYLGFVIFLFILAISDLWVGVSNDAVNFLNSAIGSKAARFRTIIIVAAIGVFCGAILSNGMMDIARHGIFRPEQFSFQELMYIFLAVMVTDIILLDVFNSLGLPTSTTVSMVFELLGATFAMAMLKMASADDGMGFADYMNTEKALSVIMAIFVSVAIAFVFGFLIQYLTRLLFSFGFKKNLKWKIGIFGGVALTAIVYFMLIKGVKDLSFMTDEAKAFLRSHFPDSAILSASAAKDEGIDEVLIELFRLAPEGEMMYDESMYTDQDLEFRLSEIIREKTISSLSDEMPHVIYVEIEDMEYSEEKKEVWVRAVINVERDGQKGMIVGKGGSNIRRIRKESFAEIRRIFPGSKLNLDLRVKADPKWRTSGKVLSRIFR